MDSRKPVLALSLAVLVSGLSAARAGDGVPTTNKNGANALASGKLGAGSGTDGTGTGGGTGSGSGSGNDAGNGSGAGLAGGEALGEESPQGQGNRPGGIGCFAEVSVVRLGKTLKILVGEEVGKGQLSMVGKGGSKSAKGWLVVGGRIKRRHEGPLDPKLVGTGRARRASW